MERGTDGRKQGHDAGKTAKNFASRTDNKDISPAQTKYRDKMFNWTNEKPKYNEKDGRTVPV